MPLQNVTQMRKDVGGSPATITGIKSISVTTKDTLEAVHIDADTFNSYVNCELGGFDVVVTGVDAEQLQGLEANASMDYDFTLDGVDGSSDVTLTIENAIAHSFKLNTPDPGGLVTATVTLSGRGDTGAASGITFA